MTDEYQSDRVEFVVEDGRRERIALLVEECAEVIQVCGKILRHGLDSMGHPDDLANPPNVELLEKELGHVQFALTLLSVNNEIDTVSVKLAMRSKALSVQKYLHVPINRESAQHIHERQL